MSPQEAYTELAFYTLALADETFIHQHIVDCWTAQTASAHTRPISLFFALAGLYLGVERGFTGRQVQAAHQRMAKNKSDIPEIAIPDTCSVFTVCDVVAAPLTGRKAAIGAWSKKVWCAYGSQHNIVRATTEMMLRQD